MRGKTVKKRLFKRQSDALQKGCGTCAGKGHIHEFKAVRVDKRVFFRLERAENVACGDGIGVIGNRKRATAGGHKM